MNPLREEKPAKFQNKDNTIRPIVIAAMGAEERSTPERDRTYDVFDAIKTLNYDSHGWIDITPFLECFGRDQLKVLETIKPVIEAFNGQPPCPQNLAAFRASLHHKLQAEGFSMRS